MACLGCRPSTAQDYSNAVSRGTTASRQPRPRTNLSRSSSASGALPAAIGPALTARGPQASLSSSDLGRGDTSTALPSLRRHSQDTEGNTMAVAAAPLPSARHRPEGRNSVPSLALPKHTPAHAAAGPEGNGHLPSARRASATPHSKAAVPSARRGTRDASSKDGASADSSAPLPSARRGTRDAPSTSMPLPSARRFTRDEAGQPMYTPRQSSDLSSKSGGRWM